MSKILKMSSFLFFIFFLVSLEELSSYHLRSFAKVPYYSKSNDFTKYIVSIRLWTAEFKEGDNHICAGAIIGETKVITAAHCIKTEKFQYPAKMLSVATGCKNRLEQTESTKIYGVKSIAYHPRYYLNPVVADIAILYLDEEIELDDENAAIIPLVESRPVGVNCTVLGWPRVVEGGPILDELLFADLYIKKPKYCLAIQKDMTACVFCATNKRRINESEGACVADPGAPLICNGTLAGISSFGIGCGVSRKSAQFFNDVSCFNMWISGNDADHLKSFYKVIIAIFIVCAYFISLVTENSDN